MKAPARIPRACVTAFLVCAALTFGSDASAGVTSLVLNSEAGDYIGGGQLLFFAEADGTFTAHQNAGTSVSIAFNTPTFSHFWYVDFAAANGAALTVGTYTGALRFPFQGNQPGLSVAGDGRGCNTLTGSFEVLEAVYGPADQVISFRATFEQHCEGFSPALRGEIRYNATVPVQLTAPSTMSGIQGQLVSFGVTATDSLGGHVTLTAQGLPSGAGFTDNVNNTGTFAWTPSSAQSGPFTMAFRGQNTQGASDTVYTRITVTPLPPPNDDFDSPSTVLSVPFTTSEDTSTGTVASDDPFCSGQSATVWYSFSPTSDMRVEVNTFGSDYDTTLSAYTGARGALSQVACNDNAGGGSQSRIRFDAAAGQTYFFMVSGYFGVPGGHLVLNVVPAPPPLSAGLTINGFGSLVPTTGVVTLSGTVRCSEPVFASISGEIKQLRGQVPLTGFFSTFVACDGTTDWTAVVQTTPALFHGRSALLFSGGKADVTASAFVFNPDTGEALEPNAAVRVSLRGKN